MIGLTTSTAPALGRASLDRPLSEVKNNEKREILEGVGRPAGRRCSGGTSTSLPAGYAHFHPEDGLWTIVQYVNINSCVVMISDDWAR